MLKVTMRIETKEGEVLEMTRNLDQGQGYDEDNLVCLFSDFVCAAPGVIYQGVELALPIHFDVMKAGDSK